MGVYQKGWYENRVLPRVVELACGGEHMERWRLQAVEGLHGTVVEIGFGSGLNMGLYPLAVTEVVAVEPSLLARERATARIASAGIPVRHVGVDGQSIPLPDNSCDSALSTFTLCTIPDVEAAISEVQRVLRPGGAFHFLEHALAPDSSVAKWQHRLEPTQRRLAGGCHLTRDPVALLVAAGMDVDVVTSRYVKGPKPWTWFTVGRATVPS